MAVIQTLREKYAKLTGGVIVVALLGFILMDYGRGGSAGDSTVGKINGQKIDITEYEDVIKNNENMLRQQMQTQTLSSSQEANIRDQAWQQLVGKHLLEKINEKLGIQVTKAEVNNLLTGSNPDPIVKQQFTNPQTGKFDPQEVSVQIQQIKNNPDQKEAWAAFENDLIARHEEQKASDLMTGAIYVPTFVAQDQMDGLTDVASAEFVQIPYASVSDDQAKVSDEEINAYIKKHAALFRVPKTTRSIQYVTFNVAPSHNDSSKVLSELNELKTAFTEASDVDGFVNHNSQNATPATYFTRDQLSTLSNADELMNAGVGTVVGPFYDGGNYDLARIISKKNLPDTVQIRHILVAIKQGTQEIRSEASAKARVDSAIAMINGGVPFDSVAARFSDDPNSRNGGELGNNFGLTQRASLASTYGDAFADFAYEGEKGESKLIKIDTGSYSAYNYIQILNQNAKVPVVKLAFVTRVLEASEETYQNLYAQASQFATGAIGGGDKFAQAATQNGLTPRTADGIDQNSFVVNGLGGANDLVKWVYDKGTKTGDVSPIYTVDGNYVVAQLTGEQPKGLLKITDQNRPMLAAEVMKVKKAQIIMDKNKNVTSLETLAQTTGQSVQAFDSVNFTQGFTPVLGNEPKVVGYAFNKDLKVNTVSTAIPGNEGVYFLKVTKREKASLPPQIASANDLKLRLKMSLVQQAPQVILNSLIQHSDVQDLRSQVY